MASSGRTRDVVVIGAGPAGLATAACLSRRGIDALVLERGDGVGQSWRDHYGHLHLHTPRIQSGLPGLAIPREYGRFPPRDDVVRYLQGYARHHGIAPRLGVEVERVDPLTATRTVWTVGPNLRAWRVSTAQGPIVARAVVVATGYNHTPRVPDWPGRDDFPGQLLHAADYLDPTPWVGRNVLVVGAGNTGAEIAADLAESGAQRVWLSVRTPPTIVPRTVGPFPTTLLGIPNEFLPPAMGDPITAALRRLTIGDLTPYGMPEPAHGVIAEHRRRDAIPIIDAGLVAQLQAGAVTPVAAVTGFRDDDVVLADGTTLRPDAVVAATGYRTGLDGLVGHLGVLDDHDRPEVAPGRAHPDAPGLWFVGLRNPLSGLLLAINRDARRVARAIDRRRADQPATTTSSD